jgi:hypothetical protein
MSRKKVKRKLYVSRTRRPRGRVPRIDVAKLVRAAYGRARPDIVRQIETHMGRAMAHIHWMARLLEPR